MPRPHLLPPRLARRLRGGLAAGALALLAAGCSRPEPAGQTYPIRGEIVGFDRPRQVMLIHHEEIPGYMPAMTMEFTAAGVDLAKLRERQRITAVMGEPVDGVFPLTQFKVLETSDDQAVAAGTMALRQDTSTRGRNVYREVGEAAPSFTLYNQDGRATQFDHFRGKWVVLNFIFTRCPIADMCPAATARMHALQLAARKAGVRDFELVSISFDSAFDTPAVLKTYAEGRGIDTSNFSFLTGPENAIRDLLAQFGVIVQPGESIFKHSLATLLINPEGKIVHRVDGSRWAVEDFLTRLPASASSPQP